MSSAAEILVVFLSVALAIFITLGIITFVLVIRVIIIGKTIFDIFNKFKNKKEKK